MREWQRYLPASVLSLGCLLVGTTKTQQRDMTLTAPLATLPRMVAGYRGVDLPISTDERRVAGVSAYLFRAFRRDSLAAFTVYVGYYDHQLQGKTVHSPKNCLPGAGWEVVSASAERLATVAGTVPVNRYLLVNEHQRALVYYWYQGRGRVEGNEYRVKLQLLRDAAFRGRSDEALVRVVVPVETTDSAAVVLGRRVSAELVPEVFRVLPG
jgi:EpsI family protein